MTVSAVYMEALRKLLQSHLPLEFRRLYENVLIEPAFAMFPASTSKHHVWEGGLAQHTYEVCNFALTSVQEYDAGIADKVDMNVVLLGCLYHDFGKCWDYKYDLENSNHAQDKWAWSKKDHYKKIHHVAKSYSEFLNNFNCLVYQDKQKIEVIYPLDTHLEAFKENVGHVILAHHGRLEYGSPVEPCTREAWIVHLADMQSVVMHGKGCING